MLESKCKDRSCKGKMKQEHFCEFACNRNLPYSSKNSKNLVEVFLYDVSVFFVLEMKY